MLLPACTVPSALTRLGASIGSQAPTLVDCSSNVTCGWAYQCSEFLQCSHITSSTTVLIADHNIWAYCCRESDHKALSELGISVYGPSVSDSRNNDTKLFV
jgi:hypothetical protein